MKSIYTFITSTISFIFVLFIVGAFIFSGVSRNEFSNYQEMKNSGVYRGYWLPEYIPKTATNIKEEHYYDSNDVFASFHYDPNETLEARNQCIEAPTEDDAIKFFCPPFIGINNLLVLHKNGNGYY